MVGVQARFRLSNQWRSPWLQFLFTNTRRYSVNSYVICSAALRVMYTAHNKLLSLRGLFFNRKRKIQENVDLEVCIVRWNIGNTNNDMLK